MIQTTPALNLEDYIKEYHQTKDLSIRNIIVENYTYLVKIISSKILQGNHNFSDREEIISEGIIGLMDAIEKFKFDNKVKFETYASIRIRGAIIDFLRKQDNVPRRLKKLNKDIDFVENELNTKFGRAPNKQEVISTLNISLKEYNDAKQTTNFSNALSIESLLWDDGIDFDVQSDLENKNEETIENKELINELANCIDKLNEREKMIISLYYVEEVKLKDIGELLNISQSRVCQIHSQVMQKLKLKLSSYV